MKKLVFGQGSPFFQLVTDLTVLQVYGRGVALQWTSTDGNIWQEDLHSYLVIANNVVVDEIPAAVGYTSSDVYIRTAVELQPNTNYNIYIQPKDINGEIGYKSNSVSFTTLNWEPQLLDNFPMDGIYSLRRMTAGATFAVRVKRSSDNAEADVYLPSSGFISLSSLLSNGQNLQTWAGNDTVSIVKIYDQTGQNDLLKNSTGISNLMENGALKETDGMPYISLIDTDITGNPNFIFYKQGFNGRTLGNPNGNLPITFIQVYKNPVTPLTGSDSDLMALSNEIGGTVALDKKKWVAKTDNSQRFWGSKILGSQPIQEKNIRTDFHSSDTYNRGSINGRENINAKNFNVDTPDPYYFGLGYNQNDQSEAVILCAAVALTDYHLADRLLQIEINKAFNNYVTL